MTNPIHLWASVGMRLDVTPEILQQLEAGNTSVLESVLSGRSGTASLDGLTVFPEHPQNGALSGKEFSFHSDLDYRNALAHYNAIVHGPDSSNTIETEYTAQYADELVYCFRNNKDILDFDMWTHCEVLLNDKLTFDEYLKLDAGFPGDFLELSKDDTEVLVSLKDQLSSIRHVGTGLAKASVLSVSVLREGECTLQDVAVDQLKAGDTVFKKPFHAYTLTATCQQEPGAGLTISCNDGSKITCEDLCSNLSGSIQEVPCTLETADHKRLNGTVLVNTYTGSLYRPIVSSLSTDDFLALMTEKGTKVTLTIHERNVPIYYDGQTDLYALPHDLRPRPSLKELLSKADTRAVHTAQKVSLSSEEHNR